MERTLKSISSWSFMGKDGGYERRKCLGCSEDSGLRKADKASGSTGNDLKSPCLVPYVTLDLQTTTDWSAPIFSTRGYESTVWGIGNGSWFRLCCWSGGVAEAEAAQSAAYWDGVW